MSLDETRELFSPARHVAKNPKLIQKRLDIAPKLKTQVPLDKEAPMPTDFVDRAKPRAFH